MGCNRSGDELKLEEAVTGRKLVKFKRKVGTARNKVHNWN